MKLMNHLFKIVESSGSNSGMLATVQLFPDHVVYKGHFPGYPVTPGVVFIQMIHELVEHHLKRTVRLVEISNCKFLKIVNPQKENSAILSIDVISNEALFHVKALGKNSSGTFFKLDAVYTIGVRLTN